MDREELEKSIKFTGVFSAAIAILGAIIMSLFLDIGIMIVAIATIICLSNLIRYVYSKVTR